MDRTKKFFAGLSAVAIMMSSVGTVFANYADVPTGVWYKNAVDAFVSAGYLDSSQPNFRGTANANRAEFVKLVVELNGGVLSAAPAVPDFDDVATGAWYYKYFAEAGKEGWVRGDGSCYGKHPCYARPSANINRAEAASIIVRAFGLESTGAAPQFVDNPSGQWYTSDIQTAGDHCVLQGDDSTGRVRPSDNMNRAEMVVMLHRVDQGLTFGEDCGKVITTDPMLTDAVATSSKVLEASFNMDVDQTVAADKSHYSVTGGTPEIVVESVKVLNAQSVEVTLVTAMDAGHQYTLTVVDMMTVDGEKFSDSKTFSGYTTVVQGDGDLEVTLSAKNPVGDTIPKGANGVVFTTLDLTAKGDDVSIENLTVLHEGFGDSADFSGIYAIVNGARVTRKRTIDTQSYTSTVRFSSPLVVKSGQTLTLQLAGDIKTSATTAGEHSLSVELPSDFVSNAKSVKGNFPLKGKPFRVAAVSAGTMSIAYRSVTPSTVKVGDKAATLGKWEVSMDSIEDQTIYSMTVENDGTSGDGDVTNLVIKRSDGTVLTKVVPQFVNKFATLVFDPPFTVLEGDKITLSLVGDVKGGAAKNAKVHFDESGDIFAVGSLYGYGVNGQLYGANVTLPAETATLPATVSIDAGQFTISVNGPTTQQYTRKTKNAVLANIDFATGGEDVDVENLYILIQGTTATGAAFNQGRQAPTAADAINEVIENVQIRNTTTGRTVSGVRLSDSADLSARSTTGTGTGAYQVYRFDDFIVHGTERYEFRVNFIDNSGTSALAAPANGDKFRIHICGEATHTLNTSNNLVSNTAGCTLGGFFAATVTTYQMKIKGVSTNDRIGDYRPGGTISGNNQEVRTATLTVSGKTTATTDTTVQNAKDVQLLRFEARASEAADILITNLVFESANGFSLVNAQNYTLWVDTNGDGKVDTKIQTGVASQSGKVTFDKVTGGGYVVPKQQAVVFEVHGDVSASLSGTNPILALRFASGSTYIQAEQVQDGTSLSGINTTTPGGSTLASNGSYTAGGTSADIQVTLALATNYTLRNQGDLYVTKSTSPLKPRQMLAGTLADPILALQFHPEFEDVDVTDIVFTASGAHAATFRTDVNHLELYKVGATTPFANATVAGCGSDAVRSNSMCVKMKNQEFVVAKGANVNILVRPKLQNDENGALSGRKFGLMLDPTPGTATGSVRARGLQSSNTLAVNDRDTTAEGEVFVGASTATNNAYISGSMNAVVLSKLVSITNADPNANGTAIPVGTTKPIAQFKFSAANNTNTKLGPNKWTLSGVIFNVNATNVALSAAGADQTADATSTFKFYNASAQNVKATCRANQVTASGSALVVTCGALNNTARSTVNTQIDPGTDATFVLEANVVSGKIAPTSTSTLQVSLGGIQDDPLNSTFSPATSHLAWVDFDGAATITDAQSSTSATTMTTASTFLWIEYPFSSVTGTTYNG